MTTAAVESTETDSETEKLLEFLYIAPVALIQFDGNGNVLMANPRVAQLFNRFAPGGYFQNLFAFLDDVLPELKEAIQNYVSPNGQIMENRRFSILAPDGQADAELWFDVTVMKQDPNMFIASMNNVTEQIKTAQENHINSQQLSVLSNAVKNHVVCTVNPEGLIDTWNRSGEVVLGVMQVAALDRTLDSLLHFNEVSLGDLMAKASKKGTSQCTVTFENSSGTTETGELTCFVFTDLKGQQIGFNMILSSE